MKIILSMMGSLKMHKYSLNVCKIIIQDAKLKENNLSRAKVRSKISNISELIA
jgi:hypothetical protein